MQRRSVSIRDRFATSATMMNHVKPIYYREVTAGMTITELKASLRLQSPQLNLAAANPFVAEAYFFYVPYRLVDTNYVDYFSNAESTYTRPVVGLTPGAIASGPFWLEPVRAADSTMAIHSYGRRAFKLAYNQYFGTPVDMGGSLDRSWYGDINNNDNASQNSPRFSKILEQRFNGVMPEALVPSRPVELPTNARDLARLLQSDKRAFYEDMSGEKYVDALRRMGVEPSWEIQMAPEFLTMKSMDLKPTYFTSTTGDDTLGKPAVRYIGDMEISMGRKMFAENGCIIGFATVRPVVSYANAVATGLLTTGRRELDEFFGDQTEYHLNLNQMLDKAVDMPLIVPRGFKWNFGNHYGVANTPYWLHNDAVLAATDYARVLYTQFDLNTNASIEGGVDMSYFLNAQVKMLSPVASKPVYGA